MSTTRRNDPGRAPGLAACRGRAAAATVRLSYEVRPRREPATARPGPADALAPRTSSSCTASSAGSSPVLRSAAPCRATRTSWNVSASPRSVLREALKTLAAKGLIEPKTRVGTRILEEKRCRFDSDILELAAAARGADAPFFENLFDIRQALEPLAAASAAPAPERRR